MTKHLQSLLASVVLPLCVASCTAETGVPSAPQPGHQVDAPLASYLYDVSGLSITPPAQLPPGLRLRTADFAPQTIARALIRTQESFTQVATAGESTSSESASYKLEVDNSQGRILVLSKLAGGPAAEVLETDLTQQSLARLAAWGVVGDETGPVLARRTLRDDSSSAPATGPVLHRYKTFVDRSIGGIPVQGHRAVLSYTPGGVFHRALLIWPPLAASGHTLSSALSIDEIKQRTTEVLHNEGCASGLVKLRWKYLPTLQASGEVTLQLVVAAKSRAAVQKSGIGEELREFDIDLSPR